MTEGVMTQTEAAAALGISDRTLRKWETRGKLTRTQDEEGRPVYLRTAVEALRNTSGSRSAASPLSSASLYENSGEERAALIAERDRLADEVAWLRARIETAEQAAVQLRVVTVQQAEALRLAMETRALPEFSSSAAYETAASEPAPTSTIVPPARVPWWLRLRLVR